MATRRPGNGQVNGDSLKDLDEDGGQTQAHHMVSDDMLYKLSKKIAQLTKVIYSLNTKNDDLEFDMENMRHGYEDKLEKVSSILSLNIRGKRDTKRKFIFQSWDSFWP